MVVLQMKVLKMKIDVHYFEEKLLMSLLFDVRVLDVVDVERVTTIMMTNSIDLLMTHRNFLILTPAVFLRTKSPNERKTFRFLVKNQIFRFTSTIDA